jgi:hypothetical protein
VVGIDVKPSETDVVGTENARGIEIECKVSYGKRLEKELGMLI